MQTCNLEILFNEDRILKVRHESDLIDVYVKRCFPWSAKNEYLSLMNFKEEEIALIDEVDNLSDSSKSALSNYFKFMEVSLEILEVYEITNEFEIRNFDVRTRQGRRKFQMKMEDYPTEGERGEVFFEDLNGDLYFVSKPSLLDKDSREKISFLID